MAAWSSSVAGHVRALGAGVVGAVVLFLLPAPCLANRYAILMCGFDDLGFRTDLSHAYITLTEFNYTEEDIIVLYYDGRFLDLNDDGQDDVDASCNSRADVAAAFDTLATRVDIANTVLFFATGHGGSYNRDSGFYPNVCVFTKDHADSLWDTELTDHFDDLEAAAGGTLRKICLIAPCKSGGFITLYGGEEEPENLTTLTNISASTSSRYDQDATYFDYGYPLTYWWTSALRRKDWDDTPVNADGNCDGFVSLREAYRLVANKEKGTSRTPLHFTKGCLLDHFTNVDGAPFPVPLIAINMTCCSHFEHHPWGPFNYNGIGFNMVGMGKGTQEMTARVVNGGTVPSPPAMLHYYYRAPTLGLGFYDTGWQWVNTQTLPPLAPDDTLDVAPFLFAVPDLNPFGEPYWTGAARIDDPANPPESGWLIDDHQVKMVNSWTVEASPGEVREIHFYAVNPLADTAQVVLGLDTSDWPSEWLFALDPAPTDTVMFVPNESKVVTLGLEAVGTAHTSGTIHVYEKLYPNFDYAACTSPTCEDSACGAFIRITGGCGITLLADLTSAPEKTQLADEPITLSLHPSVFSDRTRIDLFVPRLLTCRLTIYDVAGRRVRELASGPLTAGQHEFVWEGRDGGGKSVAPSCYFVRAEAAGRTQVRKLVKVE